LNTVLELKKKNKLPNAFKIKKHRKKTIIEKQKDVFTFLDKVFTSEMRSSNQDSTPSPLDRFKDNKTTVDETALLLHTEVRFSFNLNFILSCFFYRLVDVMMKFEY